MSHHEVPEREGEQMLSCAGRLEGVWREKKESETYIYVEDNSAVGQSRDKAN